MSQVENSLNNNKQQISGSSRSAKVLATLPARPLRPALTIIYMNLLIIIYDRGGFSEPIKKMASYAADEVRETDKEHNALFNYCLLCCQ